MKSFDERCVIYRMSSLLAKGTIVTINKSISLHSLCIYPVIAFINAAVCVSDFWTCIGIFFFHNRILRHSVPKPSLCEAIWFGLLRYGLHLQSWLLLEVCLWPQMTVFCLLEPPTQLNPAGGLDLPTIKRSKTFVWKIFLWAFYLIACQNWLNHRPCAEKKATYAVH